MNKMPMRDMVVILPGILGSVLQKNGKDIWAISGQALSSIPKMRSSSFEDLMLHNEDIIATRLIPNMHYIPGLSKMGGYSILSRWITDNFTVLKEPVEAPKVPNFFEFPYDWRKDNRISAQLLENFIADKLSQWQNYSGASDAKVILLAHSMGDSLHDTMLKYLQAGEIVAPFLLLVPLIAAQLTLSIF